jgi:hypothetical protein
MARRHLLLLAVPVVGVAFACTVKVKHGAGGSSGGHGGSPASPDCTAEFVWLQKDAYKDTPGRTTSLWPPHTTTTLSVTCPGESQPASYVYQENHGTPPTGTDDAGALLLTEMRSDTVTGSKAELLDLVTAYEACVCDPVTMFLSMDSLSGAAAQDLMKSVVAYFQTNLSCPNSGGTAALVSEIEQGDFATAISQFPACTWNDGATFVDGLNQALAAFLQGTKETLAGYHVCNNDATLQATLFEGFKATGAITACDKSSATCQGPIWFYNP